MGDCETHLRRVRRRGLEDFMADYKSGDTASWDKEQVRRSERARQTGGTRAAQQTPSRSRRRRRRRVNPVLYLLCVVLVSALLAGVGWLLASDFCGFNKTPVETTIKITSDDSMGDVADKLHDAGIIHYKWFFRLFAAFSGAGDKISAGTYTLSTEMDYRALVTAMHSSSSASADTVTITIPEGYTVRQIIALLADNGVATEEALLDTAQNYDFDYDFIDNDSTDISRLEGYLFPDTYEFYTGMSQPAGAFDRLLTNFNSKLDDDLLAQAEERGYDLKEIITIASLIEKETDGTDQGNIASVIYNRLEGSGDKQGTYGLLQIDASLLYALPDHTGPITSADMGTDSPYNLYKYAGLPPTPISNPGQAAIDAALEPENTDYYYYALGTDGRHHFFSTFAEHQAFVNSSEYGG